MTPSTDIQISPAEMPPKHWDRAGFRDVLLSLRPGKPLRIEKQYPHLDVENPVGLIGIKRNLLRHSLYYAAKETGIKIRTGAVEGSAALVVWLREGR